MQNIVGAYATIRRLLRAAALIAAVGSFGVTIMSSTGRAQTPANSANAVAQLSDEQLDELVGPIALYPDELLGITLPASTYPLEIVQAARYLEKRKSKPELKPDEKWDSSVLGLLNYPDVVEKMNQDLDWTSRLGDAVVNQQQDLMDAVQRFRARANAAGNLKSDERTTVVVEKEILKIVSASPEVIYVPSYNPAVVVVQQPAPYPYVYSAPYPYYASPAATFWTGMFVGAAIGYGIGWHGHGHNDININNNITQGSGNTINRGSGSKWNSNRERGSRGGRPEKRAGARPGAGSRTGARSGAGSRPGVGSRPAGQQRRDASRQSSRDRRGTAGGGGQAKRQQSRGSSFGNYNSGRSARTHSNRGNQSRASRSSNRTSRASSGRSSGGRGGGRGGGGGRRR